MAKVRLKKLGEQVIIITGASSGIGLVTAKEAARQGARVLLVARNEAALQRVVADIEAEGGRATYVTGDVAVPEDMERAAKTAIDTFGTFDTWVNNASSAIYGRLDEVHLADKRRLFDVTYWGVVHGCRAALPHLKAHGGSIVNVGSVASDQAIPLLGAYSAAKHAVKAYTNALRIEQDADGAPVKISLIKPASIDTRFFEHARNYTDAAPQPVPPVYAPELVAEAILHCAEHGTRELYVGGAGRAMSILGALAPKLTDRVMATAGIRQQLGDGAPNGADNLYAYAEDGQARGGYQGHVREHSLYGVAARNPMVVLAAVVGFGAALALGRRATRDHLADTADDLETDAGTSRRSVSKRGEPGFDSWRFGSQAQDEPLPPGRTVRGDTSIADAIVQGTMPATGMPADMSAGGAISEASIAGSAGGVPTGATRQNVMRGKTDEDWLALG